MEQTQTSLTIREQQFLKIAGLPPPFFNVRSYLYGNTHKSLSLRYWKQMKMIAWTSDRGTGL